ncbi:hypothetical protein LOD99_7607 [Oopsacas minuta]|uniref:Uncharacterized protein n=1 Tax=Oopsacas minuta TaxID=111878 RepID=A0AAV7JP62_9METZ|nr:hypothetical protein LOD99_7607 [Oopsacas minuta]
MTELTTVPAVRCHFVCLLLTSTDHLSQKLHSSSVDGYGDFRITVSQNSTNYHIYSTRISLTNWPFDAQCRILFEIPTITPVINDDTQLRVLFPSFRYFLVNLQPAEEHITSLFYEKVGLI